MKGKDGIYQVAVQELKKDNDIESEIESQLN